MTMCTAQSIAPSNEVVQAHGGTGWRAFPASPATNAASAIQIVAYNESVTSDFRLQTSNFKLQTSNLGCLGLLAWQRDDKCRERHGGDHAGEEIEHRGIAA